MDKTVAIGFLGTKLDSGTDEYRWNNWRPSVSIGMHDDLLISRYEMFYEPNYEKLLNVVIEDLAQVSPETEIITHQLPMDDPWDFEEVYERLHTFAKNYTFRPENEEYLINITTGSHVEQICLFLLTESRHFPGKLIQLSPPRQKRWKNPIGTYKIIDLDLSKYDRLASRFALDRQESTSFLKSGIETRNPEFNRQIERIEKVVNNSSAPILLTGATGAGKSQLARRIYELKYQKNMLAGPFVEVNCATLRGDQSMSALFGHRKGAFTGASEDRSGLLRTADKGMLFLDEIGELGSDEQAMLLRAIEEKRFLPVGSDTDVSSDFQLLAGTNRDLLQEVQKGNFREDLLARINLWTFRLPGLSERREDIEPNIEYELEQYTGRTGQKIAFNKEAKLKFLDFSMSREAIWKANFRDLNAAIVRMATLSHGGRINLETVEEEIERLKSHWSGGTVNREEADFDLLRNMLGTEKLQELDRFDRPQLSDVIRVCRECSSLSEAGRVLFDVSRTQKKSSNDADRLRKYLAKFNLDWETIIRN